MITKAIITQISDNTCTVRIPLFDTVKSISDGVPNTTFIVPPGFSNSYKVDDCVYIDFEDNEVNRPVVLGKLYLPSEKQCVGGIFCEDLRVSNSASLPINTKIIQSPGNRVGADVGGQFSINSLGDMLKSVASAAKAASGATNNLTNLNTSITDIQAALLNIEQSINALQFTNKYWIEWFANDFYPKLMQYLPPEAEIPKLLLPSTKLEPLDPLAPDGPQIVVWNTTDSNFQANYNLYGKALPTDPNLELEEPTEETP